MSTLLKVLPGVVVDSCSSRFFYCGMKKSGEETMTGEILCFRRTRKQSSGFYKIRYLFLLFFCLTGIAGKARQAVFEETFDYDNAEEFRTGSPWSGDVNDFTIVDEGGNSMLRLGENSGKDRSQIVVSSPTVYGEWEFYLQVPNSSSQNRVYIYLISDSDDLDIVGGSSTGDANGYAIHTGNGRFDLVKVNNGDAETLLSSYTEFEYETGYRIKVTRSETGEWQIFVGEGLAPDPVPDSDIVIDNEYTESNYFGIYTRTTSGYREDGYFFDNIVIRESTETLTAETAELIRADQLEVRFNRAVDPASLDVSGFTADQGMGMPSSVEPDPGDGRVVRLTFAEPFEDGKYILTINHVQDTDGGTIAPGTEVEFTAENPFWIETVRTASSTRVDVEFTTPPDPNDLRPEHFEIRNADGSGGLTPSGIEYDETEDEHTAGLTLESALREGEYELVAGDIHSHTGWPLREGTVTGFSVANPFVAEDFTVLSRTDLEILFSQEIASGGDEPSNYDLEGAGQPQSAVFTGPGRVLLRFSDPLDEGEFRLTIRNLVGAGGWEIDPDTRLEFALENTFDVVSVSPAGPDAVEVIFSEAPDETTLTAENIEVPGIGHPAEIRYDPATALYRVLFEFSSPFEEGEYTLALYQVMTPFGWPLRGETEFGFEVVNPFFVTGVEPESRTEFLVGFSMGVETADPSGFVITGAGSPDQVVLEEPDEVRLIYNDPLDAGERELVVQNVQSTEGWYIEAGTAIEFFLFDRYEEGDLLMSEFYYRVPVDWRTSTFDRPQYVEIHNRSDKLLNLRNFLISGNHISRDHDLPIHAGEYLVVARGVPVFRDRFGDRNFVEADEFPVLNLTTSGSIALETAEGEEVEELTYHAGSWGGNEVSLERRSFDAPAGFRDNWAESEDALSGSPGLPNTVSVPTDPPEAVAAGFPEPRTVQITFSGTLSEEAILHPGAFSLDHGAEIRSAEFGEDEHTIVFKTEEPLKNGIEYTFAYRNVEDIFGNRVSGTRQFRFVFENPFRILAATLTNPATLRVRFTLPVNVATATTSSFERPDGSTPAGLEFPNSETIDLTFADPFDTGSHEIVVNGIESYDPGIGEQWQVEHDSGIRFFRFDDYRKGDIVLNEFMYRPPDGYPRYVELKNRSDRFLNLNGWELRRSEGASNNGGVISGFDLPVEPGGFLVLTPDAENLEEIFGEGPWLRMDNYPGLTQTVPDRIRLIDADGEIAEVVDYDPSSWGGDGVALERRQPGLPANSGENWGESPNELRGTPGQENDVETGFDLLVTDVTALSKTRIMVQFNTAIREGDATPENFAVDGVNPDSVALEEPERVTLEFASVLSTGSKILTVTDVHTPGGFSIAEGFQAGFVVFDEYHEGDIVITEFMYRPPSAYPRYVEIYNRSERLLNLREWELRRQEGAPGNGGVFAIRDLPIEPGSYLVITDNEEQLREMFGEGPWIEMGQYPGLTRTVPDQIRLINGEGNPVETVEYDPSAWGGNGTALERKSTGISANDLHNWGESVAEQLGTPGKRNSIGPPGEGPQLAGVEVLSADTVAVLFTGATDAGRITPSNFDLSGGLSVQNVMFEHKNRAILVLSRKMVSGKTYTLTIRNIRDIFGNVLDEVSESIIYYNIETAEPGDVVINEFMYNAPDEYTRYIELYNRSDKTVNLAGWQQANDTGTRRVITREQVILPPDSYIVLLPNYLLLAVFPDIPAINAGGSLSALKNGGDNIVIANAEGTIIDSLRYRPEWGGTGVALERRRAGLSSLYAENWAPSPSQMLGTPGAANEVNRDFNLTAVSVRSLARSEIELVFNAGIRQNDAVPENFTVNGTSPSQIIRQSPDTLLLFFDTALPPGEHLLAVNGVRTQAGFAIEEDAKYPFAVFEEFETGDIVINEFMYRPPEGYTRYIELFNRSNKLLNLRNWRLQRRQISSEHPRIISEKDVLMQPGDYLVLAEDTTRMTELFGKRNYLEIADYPSFTVTVPDQIRLFTDTGLPADSLEYHPSTWGGDGVALERRSPAVPAVYRENWAEAVSENLGTPGLPNDSRPPTDPPVLLSAGQSENRGFVLQFNKRLDRQKAENLSNYRIEPGIPVSKAEPEDDSVLLFAGEPLVSDRIYKISIEGLTDIFGNEMKPVTVQVQYLEFGEAEPRDVVINEILYRRLETGKPEFVEIFNRTDDHIDLSGWVLSDVTGEAGIPEGTALRSHDFLVFTDTEAFAAESRKIIYLPGFRPLGNTGDTIILQDHSGMTVDSLSYSASWYENDPGVSLERKDPAALSIDPANWALSQDERGSTPAEKNSRYRVDREPPEIIFANMIHPDSIEVRFDKFVDLVLPEDPLSERMEFGSGPYHETGSEYRKRASTRFWINGLPAEVLHYESGQGNRVMLDGSGIQPGEEMTLAAENLGDFQGNVSFHLEHPVAQPLQPGDLVFNEIMFHPITDKRDGIPDQSDYVEIYNRRSYAVSLEGIFLHDEPDENGEITRIEPVTTSSRWIPANGFALVYPEPEPGTFAESRTARFFDLDEDFGRFALRADRATLSLPSAGRKVFLADSTLVTIDMVDYHPGWHNPNLRDTRGIALERINPDLDTNLPSNWSSSAVVTGGTPGAKNSVFQQPDFSISETGVFLEPNPFSPDGDGFDDRLYIHYRFEEPDYLLKIRIYDRYGRHVKTLADNRPAGSEGTVIWDGLTDEGERNRIGIYIILIEAYNSSTGKNRTFKETAVIARRF